MRPAEDPEYLQWLRIQRCCMCDAPPPGAAHHSTTGRGMGMKSPDWRAMALCHACHDAFHKAIGPFRWWGKEQRRGWQDAMSRLHRTFYEAERGAVFRSEDGVTMGGSK